MWFESFTKCVKLSNSDTNNFQIFKAEHRKNQSDDAGQVDVKGLCPWLAVI